MAENSLLGELELFYLSIRIYISIKRVTEEMDLSHCFLWLALALKTATPQTQQFHHVEKAVRVFTGMARCALGWGQNLLQHL